MEGVGWTDVGCTSVPMRELGGHGMIGAVKLILKEDATKDEASRVDSQWQ